MRLGPLSSRLDACDPRGRLTFATVAWPEITSASKATPIGDEGYEDSSRMLDRADREPRSVRGITLKVPLSSITTASISSKLA